MSPKRTTPTRAPQAKPEGARLPEDFTVFLVDEDDAVRDALATSVRATGHRVAAFGSARQFVEAYQPGEPGCLVVDMDLPDGGAARLLRTLAGAQIVLPAIITSRHLRRALPIGDLSSDHILFLDKPFGVDELLRLIRTVVARGPRSQSRS